MKIVGITACPTGIAHTYMAAEALTKAAQEMGHEIKIETQGVEVENIQELNQILKAIRKVDSVYDVRRKK